MQLTPTALAGCYRILPVCSEDLRGTFVKTFHEDLFKELGLPTVWREEYFSCSRKGVIRGMHFQLPPHDHDKIIYCQRGRALDVVVDLRAWSPTYGHHIAVELEAAKGHGVMIPKGMAHGFMALTDDAMMSYKVSTVYAPEFDAGILWSSFGFDWGIDEPITSARDRNLPSLSEFETPFLAP